MQQLAGSAAQRVDAGIEDEPRDDEPHHILDPPVAERVLEIGLFPRQAEADERERAAADVGEVVHCVRRDRDRPGERADDEFGRRQQDIERDGDRRAKHAVSGADAGIVRMAAVPDEQPRKKLDQSALPPLFVRGADGRVKDPRAAAERPCHLRHKAQRTVDLLFGEERRVVAVGFGLDNEPVVDL